MFAIYLIEDNHRKNRNLVSKSLKMPLRLCSLTDHSAQAMSGCVNKAEAGRITEKKHKNNRSTGERMEI